MDQSICSLYRTYLRQVRTLPHSYLRCFFRVKAADDFRSLLETKSVALRRSRLKRVSRDLRRLQAANGGDSTAFDRMLDLAYGRIGKLRWELMEPLLLDAGAPLPSSTSLRKEKTCLPAYSPELVALLTSGISRTTRPLQKHQLVSPPGLRGHAKSDCEDRVLLGPPSRRREYNIRWRFFRDEWKKVYPPLQMSLQHLDANHINMHTFSDSRLKFGFQNDIILQELFALGGLPSRLPEPPGRQGRRRIQKMSDANPFDGDLSVRWLRRRYQALLGRVPLLILRSMPQDSSKRTHDVQLADNAITTSKPHSSQLRVVDAQDVSWISDVNLTVRSGRRHE